MTFSFCTIAPFGGTMLETLVFSSGFVDEQLEDFIRPLDVREVQRSHTSNLVLLPSELAWNNDYIFAVTKERLFRLSEINMYLHQVNFQNVDIIRDNIVSSISLMKTSPGVPVFCFYGNQLNSTVKRLKFRDHFLDQPFSLEYGPGDGTVNLESLNLCEMFTDSQTESVTVEELPGVGHLDILGNRELFDALGMLLNDG